MSQSLISFPPTSKNDPIPQWVGNGFCVNKKVVRILEYSTNDQGWSDDLTTFHEHVAGEDHVIDNASRNHVLTQLNQYVPKAKPDILEVGCASGYMLKMIREKRPDAFIMGADVTYSSLLNLAKTLTNVPLLRFDLTHCPLPDNSLDVVILLNVLEHIERDNEAIRQVKRVLKPGGIAIIEVPAGPRLYDVYDKFLKHYRRYSLKTLVSVLKQEKFTILKQSHLGFLVYPAFWIVKMKNKKMKNTKNSEEQIVEANISKTSNNKLFNKIMQFEGWLGKYISYPFGIRCLITCRK